MCEGTVQQSQPSEGGQLDVILFEENESAVAFESEGVRNKVVNPEFARVLIEVKTSLSGFVDCLKQTKIHRSLAPNAKVYIVTRRSHPPTRVKNRIEEIIQDASNQISWENLPHALFLVSKQAVLEIDHEKQIIEVRTSPDITADLLKDAESKLLTVIEALHSEVGAPPDALVNEAFSNLRWKVSHIKGKLIEELREATKS
jgi:hypothetical protein